MENYTKEKLYQFGIHKLRTIARDVGVRSPTSQRKDELIDKIIAISTGRLERFVPKDKKGRPPLIEEQETDEALDFVSIFLPQENSNDENFFNSEINICAPNCDDQDLLEAKTKERQIVSGYLDVVENKIGVIREKLSMANNECCFISSTLIEKHNLRIGDYVKCEIQCLSNGLRVVQSVLLVNGANDENKRERFLEAEPIFPKKVIEFKNMKLINLLCPIGFGQRAIVSGDNAIVLKNFIIDLFNNANGEKMLVICDAQPEEIKKFENLENVVCVGGENASEKMAQIKLAANHLQRLAEMGKDSTLFIYGGQTIFEVIPGQEKGEFFTFNDVTTAFKNTKTMGSCGLVLGMENACCEIVERLYSKVFNLLVPLNSNLMLYGIKECLDVSRINPFREDEIVSQESFEKLRELKKMHFKDEEEMANALNNVK